MEEGKFKASVMHIMEASQKFDLNDDELRGCLLAALTFVYCTQETIPDALKELRKDSENQEGAVREMFGHVDQLMQLSTRRQ